MSFIPLVPLGRPLEASVAKAAAASIAHIESLQEALFAARREHAMGWGQRYIDRVHAKGKLTARERITLLADEGSALFEVGSLVNLGERFGEDLRSPGAGVVTAFAQVEGRWVMVIANDNTVASGAWWPRSPEKIQRAQQMALKLRLPVVYLVDCSGLFLPEQSRTFAGARGAGHIFKMNSVLSAAGVPQLAGVFGDCIAGGGYMPIISDRVYMTEQAYMVIAGAALIKGAKSEQVTSLDIGGPEVHVHRSACADARVPDDRTLLQWLRRDLARLPSPAGDFYRADAAPLPPLYASAELKAILPGDHREAYEVEEVIARLCDQSLFWEVMPECGEELCCGIGRVGGLYAAFIANRQGLFVNPDAPAERRPGGILYRGGIAKMSAFRRACRDDGIPLFWLQDVSGFDIGLRAEEEGLLAYGSSLIYGNSVDAGLDFSLLLRKASGAGYYAMAGLPYDPVVQLATSLTRLSVMEGRTLAIATYRSRLDEEFRIASKDPAERAELEAKMAEVEARIEADMDPLLAASRMDVDEVIALEEMRAWVVALTEMSYQNPAARRSKNPRIWSLHDLAELVSAPRSLSF